VRDFRCRAQQGNRHLAGRHDAMAVVEQRDRTLGPDRPVSEQASHDPALGRSAIDAESKRREQVSNDGVVVAGIQRDITASRRRHGSNDVESLIAIERGDLDRDNARYLDEATPEIVPEAPAANRWPPIEADDQEY